MSYRKIQIPAGDRIVADASGRLQVPDRPIIGFIEGDGIGPDITRASMLIWNRAVEKAYGGKRSIAWMELFAGEKANAVYGEPLWLPDETVDAIREYLIAIKGPLTTPIGGGIRSLNVALRQQLDLYVCLRPVRYFKGAPSPVKAPEKTDMVVFRENTEDIYAGIEWNAGTPEVKKVIDFLQKEMGVRKIRFPESSSIGVKPVSIEGSERLIRAAIEYALKNHRRNVTLVHKGNIMKFTEGGFKNWGYDLVRREFADVAVAAPDCNGVAPEGKLLVKDCICDAFLQQILPRPDEYGTAPKYANQDKVNPSSLALSGEMLLRHIGWTEAADLINRGIERAISDKVVTYDFARMMQDAAEVSCSGFARAVVERM